jgi:hypothetical protein
MGGHIAGMYQKRNMILDIGKKARREEITRKAKT